MFIILVAHNLRSTHNVGSLLRTAEGLGVNQLYLTGYTPYPLSKKDGRLPHLAAKIDSQIHKTALGSEGLVAWQHQEDIFAVIENLRQRGFTIAALEQTPQAQTLTDFKPPAKIAILVGREVEGLEPAVLKACDLALAIPMKGQKESFNVVQAAAMCLYHLTYLSR